ncbi:hypothetical protein OGAPHI_004934 [Ogataea philodendri]|uniref:Xylanolytic transcriptional activator regulatory domain-containing protein n=1 Tax=Ogataea philodendri TaxID=1378263 RepID=A0A9P8P0E2_9ASCO|nr:uncharacterized protein OGAPHI_004934 [Ogataea philodendri]KAH3663533.1 hypothetical protein OGAPHI_004934 [Ogataea philodendri]
MSQVLQKEGPSQTSHDEPHRRERHTEKDTKAGVKGPESGFTMKKTWNVKTVSVKSAGADEEDQTNSDFSETRHSNKVQSDSDTSVEDKQFERLLEPELLKSSRSAESVWNKYNFESKITPKGKISQVGDRDGKNVETYILKLCSGDGELKDAVRNSQLLQVSEMQQCLDRFFTGFNLVYPLIHLPSFETCNVDLLVAVVLAGGYDSHDVARRIMPLLRKKVFESDVYATGQLRLVQMMIICQIFALFNSSAREHQLALAHHGVLIHILRQHRYFEKTAEPKNWNDWVDCESRRRSAFIALQCDVQRSILFGADVTMSAFECLIQMPCSMSLWIASSSEWASQRTQQHPVSFLSVLQSHLECRNETSSTSGFHKQLVLHGLLNVMMNYKLNQPLLPYANWRSRCTTSLEHWKRDFDIYCKSVSNNLEDSSVFVQYSASVCALYRQGHLLLADFSGLKNVQRGPSYRSVSQHAIWHASQLLIEGYLSLDNWKVEGNLHYIWCLFSAIFVISNHFKGKSDGDLSKTLLVLSRGTPENIGTLPINPRPIVKNLQILFSHQHSELINQWAQLLVC